MAQNYHQLSQKCYLQQGLNQVLQVVVDFTRSKMSEMPKSPTSNFKLNFKKNKLKIKF